MAIPGAFSIFVEQDRFSSTNQDRNYTMGLGFLLSGRTIEKVHLDFGLDVIDRGFDWLYRQTAQRLKARSFSIRDPYPNDDPTTVTSGMLSGTAFTPDSLRSVDPVLGDRPYAFLLGWTARRVRVSPRLDRAWSSELTIGYLGLNLGRDVQTKFHRFNRRLNGTERPYDPKGWHNQISHGGEPTLRYSIGYDLQLPPEGKWTETSYFFQAAAGLAGNLGYYTDLGANAALRLGYFQSDWWEFRSAPLGAGNRVAGAAERVEVFAFATTRPYLVGYNALLQGQFKHNPYELSSAQIRRGVVEWDVGLSLRYRFCRTTSGAFRHAVAATWIPEACRSSELRGSYSRTHCWGSVFVTFQ